jgi:hypothetical protein
VGNSGRTLRLRNHAEKTYDVFGSTATSARKIPELCSTGLDTLTECAPVWAVVSSRMGATSSAVNVQWVGAPVPASVSSNEGFGSRLGPFPAMRTAKPPPSESDGRVRGPTRIESTEPSPARRTRRGGAGLDPTSAGEGGATPPAVTTSPRQTGALSGGPGLPLSASRLPATATTAREAAGITTRSGDLRLWGKPTDLQLPC